MSDASEYHPISKAAKIIGCDVSEIIHMAANQKIRLFAAISPFKQVDIFGYSPDGELLHEERNTKWFGGMAGLSPLHAKAYEAGDHAAPTYFAIQPEGREQNRYLSTIPHLLASPRPEWSSISLFVLASDVQALRASLPAMEENRTLFHKDLCDREFGSAVLHVPKVLKWAIDRGLHLRTVPALDGYEFVQVESLLCAIERGAQTDEDTANAIVANNPRLKDDRAADVAPRWLIGADAHQQWRNLIGKAINAGDLQLLDAGSLLPLSTIKPNVNTDDQPNDSPATTETPQQRRQRITEFVDKAYANGRTKESAYQELAEIEKCGVDNIKRIYKNRG